MQEEIRYQISDLSELEYKLIINALKVWRGDFGESVNTQIWYSELNNLLLKLKETHPSTNGRD